eukprot:364426-Chlamydomonas_euryale.AAC.13
MIGIVCGHVWGIPCSIPADDLGCMAAAPKHRVQTPQPSSAKHWSFAMADDEVQESCSAPPPPVVVEYDPVTGVPSEFNEYLPKDSEEYKRWKAAQEGPEALEKLKLKDEEGNEIEKKLPGGKVKTKSKPMVVLETKDRQRNKSVTSVAGLESFGIKLSEAAKILGKKFACGASVVKTPSLTEQIEMQGDYLRQIPDVLLKNYSKTHEIGKEDIFYVGWVYAHMSNNACSMQAPVVTFMCCNSTCMYATGFNAVM